VQIHCADDGQETMNDDGPENNPHYTTVYVGNLAPEVSNHHSQIFYILVCKSAVSWVSFTLLCARELCMDMLMGFLYLHDV